MARRYDGRTTIFSPEGSFLCYFIISILLLSYLKIFLGRLYQVEYAMEAISHAGTAIGILAKDGVVLAAEKKNISKLLESTSFEKLYSINQYVLYITNVVYFQT